MAKIIAIVLVMIVINAFLVFVIIRAWERTNDKVNKYFLDRSSDFYVEKDRIKSPKITKKEEPKVVISSKPVYVYNSQVDNSEYDDKNFGKKYKAVKEHLDVNKNQVIKDVINESNVYDISIENVAVKINDTFSFDVIYELSTLSSEEQIDVLKSSFDLTENSLLNQYLSSIQGKFSAIEFFSYVNNIARENDPNFYVKTGTRKDNFEKLDEKVKTVYDKEITEGIKIVHKDKMYDYSI